MDRSRHSSFQTTTLFLAYIDSPRIALPRVDDDGQLLMLLRRFRTQPTSVLEQMAKIGAMRIQEHFRLQNR